MKKMLCIIFVLGSLVGCKGEVQIQAEKLAEQRDQLIRDTKENLDIKMKEKESVIATVTNERDLLKAKIEENQKVVEVIESNPLYQALKGITPEPAKIAPSEVSVIHENIPPASPAKVSLAKSDSVNWYPCSGGCLDKKKKAIAEEIKKRQSPMKVSDFLAVESRGCDPMVVLAICVKESELATSGKGARTKNCGNVGNDDSGDEIHMGEYERGTLSVCNTLKGKQKWVSSLNQMSTGYMGGVKECKKMNGWGCYATNPSGDYGSDASSIIQRLSAKHNIYDQKITGSTKLIRG